MDWKIGLSCADPADDLTELPSLVSRAVRDGQMNEAQGQIARDIGLRLLLDGAQTVGAALDRLDGFDEATRRQWLDEARERRGLPTTAEADKRRRDALFEAAFQRLQPPEPEPWNPLQRCPACGRIPTKNNGAWAEVDCERWWCEEHRAGHEDDMRQHEPAIVGFNPNGAPVYSPAEKRRRAEWVEEHRAREKREREKREQHRGGACHQRGPFFMAVQSSYSALHGNGYRSGVPLGRGERGLRRRWPSRTQPGAGQHLLLKRVSALEPVAGSGIYDSVVAEVVEVGGAAASDSKRPS